MPASIGVNLRVTGHCSQGGRKYMEDFFAVAYQQTEDEQDLEYAFFGIYDGHGGGEAATYAKEHLMGSIVRQRKFWSDKDEDVLRAIKEGYLATHYAMWKEQVNWPKTSSGLPSTAGTTATIAFIRRAKLYIGHVGDSGVVLGYQEPGCPEWRAKPLTSDHKPENAAEMNRIKRCGGKVINKLGVPRVVWNRPRIGHQGPVRRSTPIDEIPFLAVARSLGDLWSYNSALDEFIVSPDPDTCVIPIDTNTFRCLIFGTDGLWNMVKPEIAVEIVQTTERHNEKCATTNTQQKVWINPSKSLVEKSLERWSTTKMRADNTTAVTLLLDPPGPPRAKVLGNRRKQSSENVEVPRISPDPIDTPAPPPPDYPTNGLAIMTRYSVDPCTESSDVAYARPLTPSADIPGSSHYRNDPTRPAVSCSSEPFYSLAKHSPKPSFENSKMIIKSDYLQENLEPTCTKELKNVQFTPSQEEPEPQVPTESTETSKPSVSEAIKIAEQIENIQINEVSSSSPSIDEKSVDVRPKSKKKRSGGSKQRSKLGEPKIPEGYGMTRSPVGLCTRSHDLQRIDRRIRPVLSSNDVSSTRNDGPKQTTGAVRRHTSDETRNFNKNKAELTEKIRTRGYKRNVPDYKGEPEPSTSEMSRIGVNERLFPLEPVSKKIRSLNKYNSAIVSDSNEENILHDAKCGSTRISSGLRSKQIQENTCRVPMSKVLNIENKSKGLKGLINDKERNLRERNTRSPERKPSGSRSNLNISPTRYKKPQPSLVVSKRYSSSVLSKKLTKRNRLSGKSPMQTRNRVKRFSK